MVKSHRSNFRIITAIFKVFQSKYFYSTCNTEPADTEIH